MRMFVFSSALSWTGRLSRRNPYCSVPVWQPSGWPWIRLAMRRSKSGGAARRGMIRLLRRSWQSGKGNEGSRILPPSASGDPALSKQSRSRPKGWPSFRRSILERDRYRCRRCGRAGRLEVDHVIPVDKGGAVLDPANAQTLCRGCHIAKTRAENRKPLSPERAAWRDLVAEMVKGNPG